MAFIATAIIGGSIIGAVGSNLAAGQQADAANNAANLQSSDAAKSLAEQKRQFDINQANQAPFLKTGQDAATQLGQRLNSNDLLQPWTNTFAAPTAATEANDPGYQFRLQQGQQALENSASARGGLLGGNTAVAEQQYGQDYASNEYSNVYNRALQQYQQNYNVFQNNQANAFNRLSAAAGGGQTAANNLGQQGQTAAQNVANINATSGAQIGQSMNNAAAARASGYVGATNSITGGLSSLASYYNLLNMQQGSMANNAAYANSGNLPLPTNVGTSVYG